MVSAISIPLALLCAHAAAAMRFDFGLLKRDPLPFVPQRLNIPLTFDPQGRVVTSVLMVRADPFYAIASAC